MYRTRTAELRYIKSRNTREKSCPFCDLQGREIVKKCKNLYLIKNIFGYDIWDRKKVTDHLMIIPKKHLTSFKELDKDSTLEHIRLIKEYSEKGYDAFTRATSSTIRTQPHFHTHLIKTKGNPLKIMNFNADPYFLFFK